MNRHEKMDWVSRFLDGTLSEAEERMFHEQMAHDAELARLLRDLTIQDVRLGRVSTNMALAPQRRLQFRWWQPLAAAAALVLCLYGANAWQVERAGKTVLMTVAEVRGTVAKIQNNGRKNEAFETPARVGDTLRPFDALRTGADDAVTLVYSDGSQIELQKNTRMSLAADSGAPTAGVKNRVLDWFQKHGVKNIQLDAGRLTAHVAKQPADHAMILTTPHARVAVVGTTFSLDANATRTELEVQDGQVWIENRADRKTAEVGSGEFAIVGSDDLKVGKLSLPSSPPTPTDTTKNSRAYNPDAEYTNGKIIFADTFENGLANWEKVTLNEGRCVPFDDPAHVIQVMDVKTAGCARAVVIGERTGKKSLTGIRLKIPVPSGDFSINYDWSLTKRSPPHGMEISNLEVEPGGTARTIFFDEHPLAPRALWSQRRTECIRFKDENGADGMDLKFFDNGQLRTRILYTHGKLLAIAIAADGGLELGNVTIRELVSKENAGKQTAR